jgi:hypothetical protein
MLTRTDILQSRPRKTETVPTPEWGEGTTVKVKVMNVGEFIAMTEMESRHPKSGAALWIVNTVVGDDDQLLFAEADIPAFADQPLTVVNRIVSAAQALNFRNVGDAAKNSEATPSIA